MPSLVTTFLCSVVELLQDLLQLLRDRQSKMRSVLNQAHTLVGEIEKDHRCWDELVANGYEPITCASPENDAMAKSEYESIKAMMDFEDIRIARVLEMKELCGYTVAEIAAELNISQPRVYQLLRRAREIGRKYRAQNG